MKLIRFCCRACGLSRGEAWKPGLLGIAILASCICDAGDDPFTVGMDEVEQVCPAMVHFAVDQKLEGSPHYTQIVIDPHQRIVNALFDLSGSRLADPCREILKGHLRWLAAPHQHHR